MKWVIIMHNRVELAKKFARSIESFDITSIILFGSVARGEDNEDSDIDILIVSPIAEKIKSKIHKIAIDILPKNNKQPMNGKTKHQPTTRKIHNNIQLQRTEYSKRSNRTLKNTKNINHHLLHNRK